MTSTTIGSVRAVTAHAREVPSAERARFETHLRAVLPEASVLIVTCHRVDAYVVSTDEHSAALRDSLPAGARILTGEAAVAHLVSVAVGRDSIVFGEDEILHQLREALDSARTLGRLDPVLDRLFAVALRAGRRARSWQQGRRRSLGDVALEAIERINGSIAGRPILVVGAGAMGSLTARAAKRAGATVTIANRSAERAQTLADGIGGLATGFDPGADGASAAGIIVALGGPWQIETGTLSALVASEAVVVDLSFPSAVSNELGRQLGDRLITADALALASVDNGRVSPATNDRLAALVDGSVHAFVDWLARGDARSAADALVKRADRARELELDALWRRIPALEPETRQAIEGMTRHLAARLLQEPLERLGRDADGRDGKLVRDLFSL
jgi:glutamyl-tRNA reductase